MNPVDGLPPACTTCRRPVRRRPRQPLSAASAPLEHLTPSDCPGTKADIPTGYTTQGLAVYGAFSCLPGEVHPPQRGIPPWKQRPVVYDETDPIYWRRLRVVDLDTTGTEWWGYDAPPGSDAAHAHL